MRAVAVPAGDLLPKVCEYLTAKIGIPVEMPFSQGFIILNSAQEMIGAVVVNNYRGFDCTVAAAVETPMAWSMSVRRALAQYVFGQLGCTRATAVCKIRNSKARKALEAGGFELEGKLRLGYDGAKDALIYGLLASDCAYFSGE